MSFSMTTEQVRNQTKTVTRRFGWYFAKRGDLIQPVEKAMGLKRGEKQKLIGGPIRILSAQAYPLDTITERECRLEGFPGMQPAEFIEMFCGTHKPCRPDSIIVRIEFEYIEPLRNTEAIIRETA